MRKDTTVAPYQQFNVWFWEMQEDCSYSHRLEVFETLEEAIEFANQIIDSLDSGPERRLEQIEAVYSRVW